MAQIDSSKTMRLAVGVRALNLKGDRFTGAFLSQVSNHSCCLVGRHLYVLFGTQVEGQVYSEYSEIAFALDLKDMRWRRLEAKLAPGRVSSSVFLRNDRIYSFGGAHSSYQNTDALQQYDVVFMKWSECAVLGSIPQPRYGCSGGFFEEFDAFVLFGGSRGRHTRHFGDTKWLSLKNNTWGDPIVKGRSPTPRAMTSTCTQRDTMFIFGGIHGGELLSDMFLLKILSKERVLYTQLESAYAAVGSASLNRCNRYLVLFGGERYDRNRKNLAYDILKDRWLPIDSSITRKGHQSVMLGENVLLIGGLAGSRSDFPICEVLSVHGSSNYDV